MKKKKTKRKTKPFVVQQRMWFNEIFMEMYYLFFQWVWVMFETPNYQV